MFSIKKKGVIQNMTNIPDAKNRILNAAIKIFAEKSFEGSRVEDISKTANVPKSLIYYHFKSKDDILSFLISNFLKQYQELMQIAKNDTHVDKANNIESKLTKHYSDFAIKNADLIRIMFIESLKKNNENPVIFKVVKTMIENESENIKDNENYDINERLVAEFFTGLIPLYSYICFHEKWCSYFNIDKADFDKLFITHIEQTHGAYHKNHK